MPGVIPTKTDIDLDFANRDAALLGLHHIPASDKNGRKHNSGVYFQNVPVNPLNGQCSFTAEEAEDIGYFKLDFLNQSVYQNVSSEAELDRLLGTEPPWELLSEETMVEQLPHIRGHFDVVAEINPQSIEDLAVVIALIRPGARHLRGRPRTTIDREIWKLDGSTGYYFKRAHAISYAALIVVQFNITVERLLNNDDGINF